MTQVERVLAALKVAGAHGITQADWLDSTPDDGPRITRVGARIHELREMGHWIVETGWRDKCRIYQLVEQDSGCLDHEAGRGLTSSGNSDVSPVPGPAEPTPLFDDDRTFYDRERAA